MGKSKLSNSISKYHLNALIRSAMCGLSKVEFDIDDYESRYFLVKLENN